MSRPQFDALRERLLGGGIAPRHVRRYVNELNQHFDDLLRAEIDNGVSGETAIRAARTRLGNDEGLANAMLARPELRSVTARFPWLMFGLLPLLAVIVAFALLVIAMQQVGIWSGLYIPRQGFIAPVPTWFVWALHGVMFAINFLIVPLSGALMAWVAQRQRMKLIWPLLGMGLLLLLGVHGSFHMDAQGRVIRGFGTIIPTHSLFSSAPLIPWPIFLAQAALLSLPLAWLSRARRKAATAS